MRWPEARGLFTPDDDPKTNVWYLRDQKAMAAAKKWDAPAPFYYPNRNPRCRPADCPSPASSSSACRTTICNSMLNDEDEDVSHPSDARDQPPDREDMEERARADMHRLKLKTSPPKWMHWEYETPWATSASLEQTSTVQARPAYCP